MAKAPRIRKPAETVRSRSDKAAASAKKPRRVRQTAGQAAGGLRALGRIIARIFRPLRVFSFLLWPFKTRPVRFAGRLLATILLLRYFRNSWKELRQVTWPNRRETRQLTTAVFLFAIAFGFLVSITDYGLDKIFKQVLLK